MPSVVRGAYSCVMWGVYRFLPTRLHASFQRLVNSTYNAERVKLYEIALRWLELNKIEGDFFEFGTFNGDSFLQMYFFGKKIFKKQPHFVLFDSFEGLPELKGKDKHVQWFKGQFNCSLENVQKKLKFFGVKKHDVNLVKGYYEQTLTETLSKELGNKKLRLLHIDCDLFDSTKVALNFSKKFLQEGSLILFDDYYLFSGSSEKGERGAFEEFLKENPKFKVTPWYDYSLHGKVFIVNVCE